MAPDQENMACSRRPSAITFYVFFPTPSSYHISTQPQPHYICLSSLQPPPRHKVTLPHLHPMMKYSPLNNGLHGNHIAPPTLHTECYTHTEGAGTMDVSITYSRHCRERPPPSQLPPPPSLPPKPTTLVRKLPLIFSCDCYYK